MYLIVPAEQHSYNKCLQYSVSQPIHWTVYCSFDLHHHPLHCYRSHRLSPGSCYIQKNLCSNDSIKKNDSYSNDWKKKMWHIPWNFNIRMVVRFSSLSSICFIITVAMVNDEHFHFTFIAPNTLWRLVHVNTVTRILFVMNGTVIIVVLWTSNMQAWFG